MLEKFETLYLLKVPSFLSWVPAFQPPILAVALFRAFLCRNFFFLFPYIPHSSVLYPPPSSTRPSSSSTRPSLLKGGPAGNKPLMAWAGSHAPELR